MASQEHLQQLADDSDETSSSESSSSSECASEEEPPLSTFLSSQPPKMRIKLSLKLPGGKQGPPPVPMDTDGLETARNTEGETSNAMEGDVVMEDAPLEDRDADAASKSSQASQPTSEEDKASNGDDGADALVVEATVVDDEADVDVKAGKIEEVVPVGASSTASTLAAPAASKPSKRSTQPGTSVRPAKLPAMSSPGLLIPASSGVYRGDVDANGFTTPASVFDYSMSTAGYTTERRTQHPHRGSSVKRTVDDMFDSNLLFTLHFPPLVPKDFWYKPTGKDAEDASYSKQDKQGEKERDMAQLLIEALKSPDVSTGNGQQHTAAAYSANSRKRRRPLSFSDMAPVSLTLPYPESYIEKRVQYVKQVEARERAIVASQEAALAAEEAKEKYEEELANRSSNSKQDTPVPPPIPAPIHVPPIPEPPSPPRLEDLEETSGLDKSLLDHTKHPIYFPKDKEKLVSHLDKSFFHISDGRYFGLVTNFIADPQFVGPNAPGITGLTVSTVTGLATSYVSSGAVGGGALAPSASHHIVGSSATAGGGGSSGGAGGGGGSTKSISNGMSNKAETNTASKPGPKVSTKHSKGRSPTATASDLRRLMEREDELSNAMIECITRAAVYASRTGKHGRSFTGVNGETYPEISKAFAAYAGLRPCNRCKNNKQGAYHCRLRRKHQDLDHDGGNSPAILAPLFAEPLQDLIRK